MKTVDNKKDTWVPRQKFFRGQRVKIAKEFPQMMDHFTGRGKEAIIVGSYSDLCHGFGNFSDFELLIQDTHEWYNSAWYPENLLTLISNDRIAGELILQRVAEDELEEDK